MHKKLMVMILFVFFTEISAVKLSHSESDIEIARVADKHGLILPSKRFRKVCEEKQEDDIVGAVLKSAKLSREELENHRAKVDSAVEELKKRLQQLLGSNTGSSGGSSSSSSRGSSSSSPDSMNLSDEDEVFLLLDNLSAELGSGGSKQRVASAEIQIPAAKIIVQRNLPYYDSPCGSWIKESGLGLSGSFPHSNDNDRRLKNHSVSECWYP